MRVARSAAALPRVGLLIVAVGLTSTTAVPVPCAKVVYCKDGQAHSHSDFASPTERTCTAECEGRCCVGLLACDGGRFPVCADDGDDSCSGIMACYGLGGNGGASGLVSGGSCRGQGACSYVAYDGGAVGDIAGGSCVNDYACASASRHGGAVGDISGGSCVGDNACKAAASFGGIVGDIASSCQGNWACHQLGRKNGQFQASVNACCNGAEECQYVGCLDSFCPVSPPLPEMCLLSTAPSDSPSEAPSGSPSTVLIDSPPRLPSGSPSPAPSDSPTDASNDVPTDAPSTPRNSCERHEDCAGMSKCQNNPSKCKCHTEKCRKKRKDCQTRGEVDRWGCRDGMECIAKINPQGKPKKWGKCKVVSSP